MNNALVNQKLMDWWHQDGKLRDETLYRRTTGVYRWVDGLKMGRQTIPQLALGWKWGEGRSLTRQIDLKDVEVALGGGRNINLTGVEVGMDRFETVDGENGVGLTHQPHGGQGGDGLLLFAQPCHEAPNHYHRTVFWRCLWTRTHQLHRQFRQCVF